MLDLNKEIFADIETYVKKQVFSKGDYLFRQDQVCKRIFWIRKGICRKYYLHDGKEITTEFLFEDNFVSSAKSFAMGHPAHEFAQALTELEVWSVNRENFEFLKERHPEVKNLDIRFIELYAIWLEERLLRFQTQDATTRYLTLLTEQPHYIQQIPLTYIASYLGISLETLSRIRAKISKEII